MGAVSGEWMASGTPWGTITAHEHHRFLVAIAKAEAYRSDPAFAAAWAEGQAMTLDQAIEYALQGGEVDAPSVH